MGYTKKAIGGLSWLAGLKLFTRGITFIKIAIIARFLTPSQFGLYGIAALVLTFLEILTETGINILLVQRSRDLNKYLNTMWVVSILRGALIALLIVVSAPIISFFFDQDEIVPLMLVISIAPLIKGFVNPAHVKFQKDLRFDREFILRSSVFIVESFISVLLILLLKSPYALAYGLIIGAVFEVLLTLFFINPKPKFEIRISVLKEILQKGKWITAHGIFNYFAQEGDDIAVGKIMGTYSLGVYQMAYKISILPISEITDVVARVTLPVYSKIDNDINRLKRAFFRSTLLILILSISLGSVIFTFSEHLILFFLGKEWLEANIPLKILIVYGVLRAIFGSVSTVFLAREKQSFVTIMTFVRLLSLSITIIPFVLAFGIIGASISALISVLVEIPIILYFLRILFKK